MSISALPSAPDPAPPLIIVMGVSGSGKTLVGTGIASRLALPFIEGDSLHPKDNIRKMSAAVPLTDGDRWPWLDLIGEKLRDARLTGSVVACSALKRSYRDRLRAATVSPLAFIFLHGSRSTLARRLGNRAGHFMPATLLDSQLQTLEEPLGEPLVFPISFDNSTEIVIAECLAALGRRPDCQSGLAVP
jgi:gluconokinase